MSKKSFKDFELYVEFWASEDTNSGVYIRAPNPKQVNTASGAYEVQIWDKNPNPAYSTGSLVNVAAVQPIYKAGGRWNTFEIYARGPADHRQDERRRHRERHRQQVPGRTARDPVQPGTDQGAQADHQGALGTPEAIPALVDALERIVASRGVTDGSVREPA